MPRGVARREGESADTSERQNHRGLCQSPAQDFTGRHADRAEQRVFRAALEQAQLKQHRDQAERGEDQEETHPDEEAPEIDRGLRGGLRADAQIAHEHLVQLRTQAGENPARDLRLQVARPREAQGGGRTPAGRPEFAPRRKR
jgi:hypothetical protein